MAFWQGKRVLLTGHTGFKGAWLSLWLQSLGAELLGFSLPPSTAPNLFQIAQLEKGMTSILGDLSDFNLLSKLLKKYQPEIIIHMAAQSLVRYSYDYPLQTYASNVMGTVNMLEVVRLSDSVKAVINVTSDKCYENKEISRGYCETDNLGGNDPYSSSKACAELITQAYSRAYLQNQGIGIASVRAGNVIGGGDWAKDRLVPDIIDACIKQKTVLLRYPNALRPWQHVLDALHGYLLLAQHLYELPASYSGSWNFGSNEKADKSVAWLAQRIIQHWKSPINIIIDNKTHHYEAGLLKLDSSKARTRLKWEPRWDIEKALEKTVSWYQAYQANENIRDETLLQISEFIQGETVDTLTTRV